jgi:hypothetical protein
MWSLCAAQFTIPRGIVGTFVPLSGVNSLGNRYPSGTVGTFVPLSSVHFPRESIVYETTTILANRPIHY